MASSASPLTRAPFQRWPAPSDPSTSAASPDPDSTDVTDESDRRQKAFTVLGMKEAQKANSERALEDSQGIAKSGNEGDSPKQPRVLQKSSA